MDTTQNNAVEEKVVIELTPEQKFVIEQVMRDILAEALAGEVQEQTTDSCRS